MQLSAYIRKMQKCEWAFNYLLTTYDDDKEVVFSRSLIQLSEKLRLMTLVSNVPKGCDLSIPYFSYDTKSNWIGKISVGMTHSSKSLDLLCPVWPEKNCQISIKVAQKLFPQKNEWCWHLYKNCLRMEGYLGTLIVAKGFENLTEVQ